MAIIRVGHELEGHFTTVPNSWLRDSRLSFRARGLLAMLLSHRAGWNVSVSSLVAQNKEGKSAILSAVRELEDTGYLRRDESRSGGKFDTEWVLLDPHHTVEKVVDIGVDK